MQSGLLWYDAKMNERLFDAIDECAKRYREKYGVAADTVFVNRAQLKEFALPRPAQFPKTQIAVRPSDTVMVNYVWMGQDAPLAEAQP